MGGEVKAKRAAKGEHKRQQPAYSAHTPPPRALPAQTSSGSTSREAAAWRALGRTRRAGACADTPPPALGAPLKAGQLRLLATLNEPKLAEFPDVPNLLELGYSWTSKPWLGLGGPRGLAAPVVARYQAAVAEVAASAPFAKVMLDLAILPVALGPAETARLMAQSLAEHERIARAIKIGRFARG